MLITYLVITGSLFTQTGEKVDVLIVENPQNLTIYDRYQQELSSDKKLSLPRYSPMIILEQFGTFSDGLRNYMKVDVNHNEYFLLAKSKNKPILAADPGKTFLLKSKTPVRDSVEIIKGEKIQLRFPDSQNKIYLHGGDQLVRVFKDVSEYYVYHLNTGRFGWARFPAEQEGKTWRKKVSGYQAPVIGYSEIIKRVREKTGDYNDVILSLFKHLNSKTGKNLAMPYWAINEQDTYTDIVFVDHGGRFTQSVSGMTDEIRKIISISELKYQTVNNGLRILLN